jgi:hypothetical protein
MSKRKQWFWTALATALLFVIHYARCPIYSIGWRAVHGSSIQCGGYRIQVPWGWWANSSPRGTCLLSTWSPTYTIGWQKPILATFHVVVDSPPISDNQWRQDVLNRLQRDGYSVTGVSELQVAGRATFCFESDIPAKFPERYVLCNVEKGMIVEFSYDGKRWKDRFYEILRGVS